jgi:predicted Ser/Thr protein kinase
MSMEPQENAENIIELNPEPPRPDHSFPNFHIFEEIGQGGMGVVYRARDLSLDRIVAIKVLREELRSHEHIVSRFQREARAAATLDHPNIVQLYAISGHEEVPYFSMEYIDGAALSTVMQGYNRIPWRQALGIAEQIAAALASAHHKQIVHRDIKPANILIGRKGRAYITDFGIAKILTADTQLTVDGSRLGTPQYMSPERCRNEEVTDSSDIYSLGIVLFQMIAGTLPYQATSKVDMVRKILGDAPARLKQYEPDIPDDVERLVAHLIEKKPQDRPESAEQVIELISRVRSGRPLDEGGSQLASALAEFRDTMTSSGSDHPTPLDITTIAQDDAPIGTNRVWRDLPGPLRFAFTACAVALAAVGAGSMVAMLVNHNRAQQALQLEGEQNIWEVSQAVASFFDAEDGVIRTKIELPDFSPIDFGWAPDGSRAYVTLEGLADTPRAGQRALVGLNPETREARLTIPPTGLARGSRVYPSFSVLGFGRNAPSDSALAADYILRHTIIDPTNSAQSLQLFGGDWIGPVRTPPGDSIPPLVEPIEALDGVDLTRVQAVVVDPAGEWIAIAIQSLDHANSSFVGTWDGHSESAKRIFRRTELGPRITALTIAPEGDRIAFLREDGEDEYSLWMIYTDDTAYETESYLGNGRLTLHEDAFDPRYAALVITETSDQGESSLRIVGDSTGETEADLGLGSMAAWHPTGNYLIATAPDHRSNAQVWRIERNAPNTRSQLTHLSEGTVDTLALSKDGAWALTVENSRTPRAIFVRLGSSESVPRP